MQEDGCAPNVTEIFEAPRVEGVALVTFVQRYVDAAVSIVVAGLDDESGGDEYFRMSQYQQRVASFSIKLTQLFNWARAAHPDFTEMNDAHQKWIRAKLIADFLRIVAEPLGITSIDEVVILHNTLAEEGQAGFTIKSMQDIMQFLTSVVSASPKRDEACWAFMEHYFMKYAFDPIMVGERPEEDVTNVVTYLSALQSNCAKLDSMDETMDQLQDTILDQLNNLKSNSEGGFEFSTPCRVSMMGHLLACGDFLDKDDYLPFSIENYLDSASYNADTDSVDMDNSFSVLVAQAMGDKLLADYNRCIPADMVSKLEKDPSCRLRIMAPAIEFLTRLADEAAVEVTLFIDSNNLGRIRWLYAIAKTRLVLTEAGLEVARIQNNSSMPGFEKCDDLIAAGNKLLTCDVTQGLYEGR